MYTSANDIHDAPVPPIVSRSSLAGRSAVSQPHILYVCGAAKQFGVLLWLHDSMT